MSINLDQLIEQRKEATGVEGDRVSFEFTATAGPNKGKKQTYTMLDPTLLTDEQVEDIAALPDYGPDVAEYYMGEKEYDRFLEDGGSCSLWALVVNDIRERMEATDSSGRPTRPNRSSRRARKR